MSIVDDYAGIAAELRRLKSEKPPADNAADARREPSPHRMRATIAGELLYRRLVSQSRRRKLNAGRNEIAGMIAGAKRRSRPGPTAAVAELHKRHPRQPVRASRDYSGIEPPGNGMIGTVPPAGSAGACGGRMTRQSDEASGRIIELSCTSNGTASRTPSAARASRARR